MKTHSAKNKGRKLQKDVCEMIKSTFPVLQEEDITWCSMGSQGEDIKLSPVARFYVPLSIECKNVEANKSIYNWYHQAEANAKRNTPCVVMHRNREDILAVIKFTDLLNLLSLLQPTCCKDDQITPSDNSQPDPLL